MGGGVGTAAFADPAPPGRAEALAGAVDPILAVGHTQASAEQSTDDSSATANAIELPAGSAAGPAGGTQTGPGEQSGAILDTGVTPLGRVALAPWEASVTGDDAAHTAKADAALLRLFVLEPGAVMLDVLQSYSEAGYTDDGTSTASSGRSASDGAVLNLGDGQLEVVLLHAETSSDGSGESYLAAVNDNKIFTSEDAGEQCALEVPSLVTLSCLRASGGVGSANALVADLVVGDGDINGDVVQASSSSGTGTSAGTETARVFAGDQSRGLLAATGTETLALVGLALLFLSGGMAIVRGTSSGRPASL